VHFLLKAHPIHQVTSIQQNKQIKKTAVAAAKGVEHVASVYGHTPKEKHLCSRCGYIDVLQEQYDLSEQVSAYMMAKPFYRQVYHMWTSMQSCQIWYKFG
jgi:hypothetical protein